MVLLGRVNVSHSTSAVFYKLYQEEHPRSRIQTRMYTHIHIHTHLIHDTAIIYYYCNITATIIIITGCLSIRLVSSSNPNYYVTIFIDNKIRNKHWSNNCNKKVTPRRRWNIRIRLMLLAFTFLFGKGYIYTHIYNIYFEILSFYGKKIVLVISRPTMRRLYTYVLHFSCPIETGSNSTADKTTFDFLKK